MTPTVAIIGSGIAGMACAHLLQERYQIQVFEQHASIGGHTNTITVEEDGRSVPIDTGFMVFAFETYPNLTRLFKHFNVPIKPTDMSFSVQHGPSGLEWNGAGFNTLFGDRRNLCNLRFWQLLRQLQRFCRQAPAIADNTALATQSVEDFVNAHGYDADFLEWFLLPMGAAIWSTAPERMRQFPIQTLVRFFLRHRFLGLNHHLQWYTVDGGAQVYKQRLTAPFRDRLHVSRPVASVQRQTDGVTLCFLDGSSERFDHAVLACHADQAMALLQSPTPLEAALLPLFTYEENVTQLHTDASVMPRQRRCWAAWNYRLSTQRRLDAAGHLVTTLRPSTHYWMNRLQGVSDKHGYFVSLNAADRVNPATVRWATTYHHPLFTIPAIAAQARLPELNASDPDRRLMFCGSYFGYGFHEDALTAGLNACRQLTGDEALCL